MTPSHHTPPTPLDHVLALAFHYAGFQLRAIAEHARSHVADAHGMLDEALGHRGIVTTRAAILAIRALMMGLAECAARNVTPLARSLARAEALTALRALLDGPAPADPRAELRAAWSAWRCAPGVDECVRLAHAALRLGECHVEGEPSLLPIHDDTGRQLARDLGRADLLGEADAPGPVAASTEAPSPVRRAPRARLEVV